MMASVSNHGGVPYQNDDNGDDKPVQQSQQPSNVEHNSPPSVPTTTCSPSAPTLFPEASELMECVAKLIVAPSCHNDIITDETGNSSNKILRTTVAEAALHRVRTILDQYLDGPTLLDPWLDRLVTQIAKPVATALQQQQKTSSSSVPSLPNDPDKTTHHHPSTDADNAYLLSALYSLGKVRGRKCVQRFLPHGVEHVEPVFRGLQRAVVAAIKATASTTSTTNAVPWESTYTLFVWMTALALVPFHYSVIIGDDDDEHNRNTTIKDDTIHECLSVSSSTALPPQRHSFPFQLVHVCVTQLSEAGPVRTVAAACLAAWLSRPDFDETDQLLRFVTMAQSNVQDYLMTTAVAGPLSTSSGCSGGSNTTTRTTTGSKLVDAREARNVFRIMGILQVLTGVLKASKAARQELVRKIDVVWDVLWQLADRESDTKRSNNLVSQLLVKWWTRMSCALLPPRVMTEWRYQCGRRSMFDQLNGKDANYCNDCAKAEIHSSKTAADCTPPPTQTALSERLFLVPDQVEDAMGRLLESLRHSSTIVRWSAAKGIGRVTERLPALCAHDVVDAVLELFEDPEKDHCWHGACLTLAELARRGLLLPDRLNEVVPLIARALHFDLRRGQSSVGANVRDAACYTYWAFARAYSPEILQPHVTVLRHSIVLVCLFDREVNCRRAASAAFQEAVGRQGAHNFPFGIDILTLADYYSLGNRSNAYMSLAVKVAEFEDYRRPIIRHLYTCRLFHWDPNIRSLASTSLHKLVYLDTDYICAAVVPTLLVKALDENDMYTRHGAVLGVAEIVLALSGTGNIECLSARDHGLLADLVEDIEKKRLYRGRGGEIMRSAVCRLIECMSLACLKLTVTQQVRLLDVVDANLSHPMDAIQQSGCDALKVLMTSYFPVSAKGPSERLQKRVVGTFVDKAATSPNPAVTRGYARALGYLPAKLLAPNESSLNSVLSCLEGLSNAKSSIGGECDADTRHNALLSLSLIFTTIGLTREMNGFCIVTYRNVVLRLLKCFLGALDDYGVDRRGDVGSWCRIAAMKGLTDVLLSTASGTNREVQINGSDATKIVAALLKQLAEKLTTIRKCAGSCLERILLSKSSESLGILYQKELMQALAVTDFTSNPLSRDCLSHTYSRVMKVASIPTYFEAVIEGIVISVGSLTSDVSSDSTECFLQWMRVGDVDRKTRTGLFLVRLLDIHTKTGRIILPILKTLNVVFSRGLLDKATQSHQSFSESCQYNIQREACRTKDVHRLFAAIDVTVALLLALPKQTVRHRALAFLCYLLSHKYPRVRGYTANNLYVFLLERKSFNCEEVLDDVLNTPWASMKLSESKVSSAKMAEQLHVSTDYALLIDS